MDWLNYHHLFYFWTVAREGGIARACAKLKLAQPTVSGQIATLERSLGQKLFLRQGRTLTLTETGRTVYDYAEEIFGLGRELLTAVRGAPRGQPLHLRVGVPACLSQRLVRRLLEPVCREPDFQGTQVTCHTDCLERLLAALSLRDIDVVLSDTQIRASTLARLHHHRLGGCGLTFFAPAEAAEELRTNFPHRLDDAPFLLPAAHSARRRGLEKWFHHYGVRPLIRGEFNDSALLEQFGLAGAGVFALPTVLEAEVLGQSDLSVLGRTEMVTETLFALTAERKMRHPAVRALAQGAHALFGEAVADR
jgi:LysR family transcriptional activator of nhaA